MLARLCVALVLILGAVSCGWLESGPQGPAATLDVAKKPGEQKYTPPADGRLSETQVRMYLEVQRRAAELRKEASERLDKQSEKANEAEEVGSEEKSLLEGMKAFGKVGDVLTADIRAARELGVNSAEYEWVKGQVLEAYMSDWYNASAKSFQEKSLRSLKKARDVANKQDQDFYDEQIAGLERNLKEQEEKTNAPGQEALRSNVELIRKFKPELDALKAAEKRAD